MRQPVCRAREESQEYDYDKCHLEVFRTVAGHDLLTLTLRLHSIHRKDRRQYRAHKRSKTLHDLGSKIRVPYLKRQVHLRTLTGASSIATPWSSPLIGRVLHLKRREQKLAATASSPSRLSAARLEDDLRAFANLAESLQHLGPD